MFLCYRRGVINCNYYRVVTDMVKKILSLILGVYFTLDLSYSFLQDPYYDVENYVGIQGTLWVDQCLGLDAQCGYTRNFQTEDARRFERTENYIYFNKTFTISE